MSSFLPSDEATITGLQERGLIDESTAAILRQRAQLSQSPPADSGLPPQDMPTADPAQMAGPSPMGPEIPQAPPAAMPVSSAPQAAQPQAPPVTPKNADALGRMMQTNEEAQAHALKANDLRAEAATQQAALEKPLIDEELHNAQKAYEQNEAINRQSQILTDASMEMGKKRIDAISNAKVDPLRFMQGDRGLLAAISVAFGAMGSALTGTPNYALDIVNKAIDRDIHAQEYEINKQGDLADLQGNQLAEMMKIYGNKSAAILATQALASRVVAVKMKQIAATTNDKTLQSERLDAAAKIEQQGAALFGKAAEIQNDFNKTNLTARMHREEMGMRREELGVRKAEAGQKAEDAKQKDLASRFVEGAGYVNDWRDAPKMREAKAEADKFITKAQKALSMMDNPTFFHEWTEKGGRGEELRQEIIGHAGVLFGLRTLQEHEYKRLADLLRNPAALQYSGAARGAYKEILDNAFDDIKTKFSSTGLKQYIPPVYDPEQEKLSEPVKTGFAPADTGE